MNTEARRFNVWLSSLQPWLCRACGQAMQLGMSELPGHELESANTTVSKLYSERRGELLIKGRDSDYALPGVGPLYIGHWHGKRVRDALAVLFPLLPILSSRPRTIIDFGAGTGAVLWAWTLLAGWRAATGQSVPRHAWFSLDSSRSMLEENDRLWMKLRSVLPSADAVVEREAPYFGDWRNHPPLPTDAIVIGSFLLSHSDLAQYRYTASQFVKVLLRLESIGLVLWTSSGKSRVFNLIVPMLIGWNDKTPSELFDCALKGPMGGCLAAARAVFKSKGLLPDPEWERRFLWGVHPCSADVLAMFL